jgi:endonuclease/exonuclease/phosphatase family metal-dependent hydrolase
MAIGVMTCNVRCSGAQDGPDNWDLRKEVCVQVMLSRDPDVICCQELWEPQYADLRAMLRGYAAYGITDSPTGRRLVNALFWLRDRFAPICGSGYWLSQTPHVPGSKSWDSDCIRLANWVRLEDADTKRELRVISTHLDHVSQPAREGQARVINEDAAAYPPDYPQVLAGDMNASAANPAIAILREAGWLDACEGFSRAGADQCTFHGFGRARQHTERIDWIFIRGPMKAANAEIVRDMPSGRYPSDHYFVFAELNWLT